MEADGTGVVAHRPAPRTVTVVITAVALGMLAFLADAVEGVAGQIVVALVSSGLAWGLAALPTDRAASSRRRAVTGATENLVSVADEDVLLAGCFPVRVLRLAE